MSKTTTKRRWRAATSRRVQNAAAAALAAGVLLVAVAPAPATAAELDWHGVGVSSLSYMKSVTVNGNTYDVTRGLDNGIWFRFNNGAWRELGGLQGRTNYAPAIVQFQDRVMVAHQGTDSQIYWTVVQNPASNQWEPWHRIEGDAAAWGGISLESLGSTVLFDWADVHGLYRITSVHARPDGTRSQTGISYPNGQWHVGPQGGGTTGIRRPSPIMAWNEAAGAEMERIYLVGTDNHVWQAWRNPGTGATGNITQVPGGGVCTSGVSAARLGYQDYTVSPGNAAYANQRRQMLACIGGDGYVWINTSSTGGEAWDGWRRPSGALAPSTDTPAINATTSQFTLTVSWNGARSTQFPDHAIVEKRLW
ncbi:hypothetical protein ACIF6L_38620 [Kitasatospora sp. NPDC086009]|uniref:hypothetical protein n=1 Tax=unclassified Kitasatospora TaxID=2633591 RepID=UPI0037C7E28B